MNYFVKMCSMAHGCDLAERLLRPIPTPTRYTPNGDRPGAVGPHAKFLGNLTPRELIWNSIRNFGTP